MISNRTFISAPANLGTANRNPLNIRYAARNRWIGLDPVRPNVRGFCRFVSVAHGFRAAIVLLKNYIRRGCNTPRRIIARWAPPSENRTALYVAAVCGRSRLRPDECLSPDGPQVGRLVAAMARQETGTHITPEGVDELRRRFGL